MFSSRRVVTSLLFSTLFSSLGTAQDLSKYRDFQFGMRLESVAKQLHMEASAAKTTHERPAVIQTLQWDQLRFSNPATDDRSLRSIRFDFYNGELFKMVVMYDPVGTEGLTTEDMVEAIVNTFHAPGSWVLLEGQLPAVEDASVTELQLWFGTATNPAWKGTVWVDDVRIE